MTSLLEGRLTQPYYLFRERSEFESGSEVSEADFLEAKRRCCETLIRHSVQDILGGSYYTFDWRPSVRKALAFLDKELSDYTDVENLNHVMRNRSYAWQE